MVTCIDYEICIHIILFSFELMKSHHLLTDFLHVTNEIGPKKCCSE